jgi:site-specific DNA-methyltransferase (adenine-specific)/site-specific DNA-methyltransferase (cytosine-N4-specific)
MSSVILEGDCFELIKEQPDNSVDLVITSPPYADIVNYGKNISIKKPNEYVDWLLPLFNEIYRVLKPSGSFILNINDNCSGGYRNPFIYELIYRSQKETKLKFYDTYIWHKMNGIPNGSKKRFRNNTEFIFHFVKNQKELKFYMDRVLEDTNIETKKRFERNGLFKPQGEVIDGVRIKNKNIDLTVKDKVRPDNVFRFPTAGAARDNTIRHPAPYHKELPTYFINLLTDEGDVVLDVFSGIGTTGLGCNNREYIGYELNPKYVEFSKKRLNGEELETYIINQYDLEGNFIQTFNTLLEIENYFGKPCVNNIKNILRGYKRNFTLWDFDWKLEKRL